MIALLNQRRQKNFETERKLKFLANKESFYLANIKETRKE